MITLGFDSWDRGLSGHGNRGHRKAHDYHYYPRRTDERYHGHAQHYDRNAFMNINHVWSTYDGNDKPDVNSRWSNFVAPPGYSAPGYSSGNDSGMYTGRNHEDSKPVNDFRKKQEEHILDKGPGKSQKDFKDNAQGNR